MICKDCAVQDHEPCVNGSADMLYPPCDCQHRENVTHGKIDLTVAGASEPDLVDIDLVAAVLEYGAGHSQSAPDADCRPDSAHTEQASGDNPTVVQGTELPTEPEESPGSVAGFAI